MLDVVNILVDVGTFFDMMGFLSPLYAGVVHVAHCAEYLSTVSSLG